LLIISVIVENEVIASSDVITICDRMVLDELITVRERSGFGRWRFGRKYLG
jgi:hypothetical protein